MVTGRMTNSDETSPKAPFLAPDGNTYPDNLICSGVIPAELNSKPCPYSQNGHMPAPVPLNADDETYSIDKGKLCDMCPPCASQQLSNLEHWQGYKGQNYPENLLPLMLFKCWQGFWLIVPGIRDDDAGSWENH